jgi:hypothetical protein
MRTCVTMGIPACVVGRCVRSGRSTLHLLHSAHRSDIAAPNKWALLKPAARWTCLMPTSSTITPAKDAAFEPHYRIDALAKMWQLSRNTVRLIIKDEPGVIKIRLGLKKAHTSYSVPESVARRIHTRLLNAA